MKKKFTTFKPQKVEIDIDKNKIHAYCDDIITSSEEFYPMLVLSTFFEPRYYNAYQNKEITEEELHNLGTGYVHAVGNDGIVKLLQYYEYCILSKGDISEKYKNEIMSKWECEDIEYMVNHRLCKKTK